MQLDTMLSWHRAHRKEWDVVLPVPPPLTTPNLVNKLPVPPVPEGMRNSPSNQLLRISGAGIVLLLAKDFLMLTGAAGNAH